MPNYPLVKLPDEIDYVLFLIKEELKSRHFFRGLHSVGLEDIYFQPHLDILILKLLGLDDGSDETFQFYTSVMDKRSKKISADNDSVVTQAMKVYVELVGKGRSRNSR